MRLPVSLMVLWRTTYYTGVGIIILYTVEEVAHF